MITLYNPKGFHPQLLNSICKRWDVGTVKSIIIYMDAPLWQFYYRNQELVCLKIITLSSLEIVLLYWDNTVDNGCGTAFVMLLMQSVFD